MNLYIKNLDYKIEDAELKGLFTPLGKVKSFRIVRDKITGIGKGFGFVEMINEREALNAIHELNETTFRNRLISVSKAIPQLTR